MPPLADTSYWRSLNQLAETPEFRQMVENEFPSRVNELVDPLSRRRFLQVMGASLAMAGLTGCDFDLGWSPRWPKERILPFTRRPEGRSPGTPVHYATALERDGVAHPLLAKSYDGRPIKVEGNPDHPQSQGATGSDAFAQASVLSLYDPDRSKGVRSGSSESDWASFLKWVRPVMDDLRQRRGKGLVVLAEPTSSETFRWLLNDRLGADLPELRYVEWSPVGRDEEWAGARLALDPAGKASFRSDLLLDKARVIVSLDADLLGSHPHSTTLSRRFAAGRRVLGGAGHASMNRLYMAEGVLSLTGSNADERLALAPSKIPALALDLAGRLVADERLAARLGRAGFGEVKARLAALRGQLGESWSGLSGAAAAELEQFSKAAVEDLLAHPGASVIAVGERQPAALHALGHLLNEVLGNVGETVRYAFEPRRPYAPLATDAETSGPKSRLEALQLLAKELESGALEAHTLIVIGANPVHDAPADLGFRALLGKFKNTVHLGLYADETAQACAWHLPQTHYLEAWGDARSWDGTLTLTQPLIAPIFERKSACELLALLHGKPPVAGYELVRAAVAGLIRPGADFESVWRRGLHDGALRADLLTAGPAPAAALQPGAVLSALDPLAAAGEAGKLELVLYPDGKVFDGRYANNAWLQELPDPLTKLTWDNALLMGPETAASLGLADNAAGDLIEVSGPSGRVEAPAYVLPGMATGTLALALGYGREGAGVVAKGSGVNAYPLRSSSAMHLVRVTARRTGKVYALATTQDHHAIDTEINRKELQKRLGGPEAPASMWLVREASLAQFQADPDFAQAIVGPRPETTQMWDSPIDYEKAPYRWAMAIDLTACTGCGACVVACQAENNIPVVGKSEVARGREMHWIRIDRYFSGDPRTPLEEGAKPRRLSVVHQPMPCQQCENAPCESVCPVAATVHSTDGLNDMVYNRCIGTRYCSNNCPYKVRRFNYFYNHYGPFHPRSEPGEPTLPKPPEVTSRLHVVGKEAAEIEQLAFNPEVTVRARGVMEKCTFCVQRIKAATIPARNERRALRDGEVKTACQQSCPSEAIVFGDLQDPKSEVSKRMADPRTYSMLAELNARPRTRYLAKLRNPSSVKG